MTRYFQNSVAGAKKSIRWYSRKDRKGKKGTIYYKSYIS